MITGILAAVVGIAVFCCAGDGEWGSVAVGAVLIVILLCLGSASREGDRAYNNFVDYWSKGGPDGE